MATDTAAYGADSAASLSNAIGAMVRQWLEMEREGQYLLCWFVVCFACGIILFFQSDGSSGVAAPLTGMAICVAIVRSCRRYRAASIMAVAAFAVFAGFFCGVVRLYRAQAPVLTTVTIGNLTGYVETVERRVGRRSQLVVAPATLHTLAADVMPSRVRLTARADNEFRAGDFIAAKVRLVPLPQPVRPGGYDFARDAYFKGLGAVGSVLGRADVAEPLAAPSLALTVKAAIDRARNVLTERIHLAIGGEAGGVAAALVTGKRGYISEDTNDVLRAAGIYHIVSISGLHMVIAAGLVFWLVRAVLALFMVPALQWRLKKIAAIVSILAAVGYCLFSGAEVATLRALIMTLIMLGAILVERKALSMRNLAIAALLILTVTPEALLSPGFQMSFAAVAALIALAAMMRLGRNDTAAGWIARLWRAGVRAAAALLMTTLVAGFATAPFAAYHFQTAVPFGLIGNSLALPLVSVFVMPLGALGAIAYPFGLDQPVWQFMGVAITAVLNVSGWVASLDGALQHFPAFSGQALLLLASSLIVATVMVSPLRYAGVLPMVLGFMAAAHPERHIAFIDRDGRAAAVRGQDGRLFIVGNANEFLIEQWLRADGDGRPPTDASLRTPARCDANGCVGYGMRTVAVVKRPAALREDCRRADIVVSRYSAPQKCAAAVVIDHHRLAMSGAATVSLGTDQRLEVTHARDPGMAWPWQLSAAVARQPASF